MWRAVDEYWHITNNISTIIYIIIILILLLLILFIIYSIKLATLKWFDKFLYIIDYIILYWYYIMIYIDYWLLINS
jgi:hypothetical protein